MVLKRRIVLLGPPASGKGTQAHLLSTHFNIPTASTGAMLRHEIADGTAIGLEASQYTNDGGFVPDELVLRIVSAWMDKHENGFILDGFPRTLSQAEALEKDLVKRQRSLDIAFLFNLSDKEIHERVTNRLTCDACGATFGEQLHSLKEKSVCPHCGGVLTHRKDDTEATLVNRLAIYQEKTLPIANFYRERGILNECDGSVAPEILFEKLSNALKGVASV
ncbi:MAG: nucleoside monophosphate kinase [Chthoniobacterales bacterium]